jgi:hypothetical protein
MDDPKDILEEFCRACSQLKIRYDLVQALFLSSPAQAEMLRDCAQWTFHDIYEVMRDHFFIEVCRLTEDAGRGNKTKLTTNLILYRLPWPHEIKKELATINDRLNVFRKYAEPARHLRGAHFNLRAQLDKAPALGKFPLNADKQFFTDLEAFCSIANMHINDAAFELPSNSEQDVYLLVRALIKAKLYDQCDGCTQYARTTAILNYEASL